MESGSSGTDADTHYGEDLFSKVILQIIRFSESTEIDNETTQV